MEIDTRVADRMQLGTTGARMETSDRRTVRPGLGGGGR